MSGETYKILAGILALEQFTGAQLAEATGVNPHTVNSWLQRNNRADRYVADVGSDAGSGRGRPRKLWQLRAEDADEIRRELGSLAGLAKTERDLSDYEEARRAFEDPDIRSDIYYHIYQAECAPSKAKRDEALRKARKWYDFEVERLNAWQDAGYTPPPAVSDELSRLNRRIEGMRICAEKLGAMALKGVDGFADWFEKGIECWFDEECLVEDAFLPLMPASTDTDDRKQGLRNTLQIVLETSEECSIVSQDFLICGLLMAMARVRTADAYLVIADIFEDVGYDTIGNALNARLNAVHDTDATQRFIHHVLVALADNPAMLQNKVIGNWADGLLSHRLYNPRLCLSLLLCLERRDQVDLMRLACEKQPELRQMRQIVSEVSDTWHDLNAGIARDRDETLEQIDRMLSLGEAAPGIFIDGLAASQTEEQPKPRGMADFFQSFFAPGSADHVPV